MSEINTTPAAVSSEASPSDLMGDIMDTIDPGGSDSPGSSGPDKVIANSSGELAPESADDEPLHPEDPDADLDLNSQPLSASTPASTPAADAAAKALADQQKDPQGDQWDEEVGPPTVVKRSNGEESYQWSKARGQRIYEGFKASKQYQEIAPTVEEARAHQGAFIDQMQMLSDLRGDNPQGIDLFLGHWNRLAPQAIVEAAETMVQHLPKANPAAYAKIASTVIDRTADSFYQKYLTAMESGDTGLAERLLFAAQSIDYFQNRPYRTPNGITRPAPVNEREQQLKQREDALNRTQSEQASSQWKSWADATNSTIRTDMQGELAKAMAPLTALKEANPKAYDRAVKDLNDAIREGLDADQNWNDLFNLRYRQSRRSQSDADRTALKNQYLGRFRVELGKRAPGIIKEFTDTFMSNVHARKARVENSAARKEVSGGAASSTKPISTGGRYRNATTVEEKVNALIGL